MARVTTPRPQQNTFLPPVLADYCRDALKKLSGYALIALALFLFFSLFSYDPNDASLNTAAQGNPQNYFGKSGAILADFLIQALGVASSILVLWIGGWGIKLYLRQELPLWNKRLLAGLSAVMLAAIGFAALPTLSFWKHTTAMGGATGSLLLSIIESVVHLSAYIPAPLIGTGFLVISLFLLKYAVAASTETVVKTLQTSYSMGYAGASKGATAVWYAAVLAGKAKRLLPRYEALPSMPSLPSLPKPRPKPAKPLALAASEPTVVAVTANPAKKDVASKKSSGSTIPTLHHGLISLPPLELLNENKSKSVHIDKKYLAQRMEELARVLEEYGVKGTIIDAHPGPVVTMFELEPAAGIKSSRVISLADDIARSMSAISARVAVVPGRNIIGIELPNAVREMVSFKAVLAHETYSKHKTKLPLALGKDIGGNPVVVDLAKMPHLLVAGTTGSGKSVSVNAMILSLLFALRPDECRFIMVDPKMLELSVYDGIPHLLTPVVTDPKKAVVALKWTVKEMEQRYQAMSKLGVRTIEGYNQRIGEARAKGEVLYRRVQTGFDPDTGKPIYEDQQLPLDPLPFIVVIIDEMADLMLVAGKDIEAAVQRLAQMARAAGIHIITATQRPSVDVITGTIKANFPTRISFQVTSKIDSRTILGEMGAEQLLGQGDMLHMAGGGRISRVHAPFVSDAEVEKVVAFLKQQGTPQYIEDVTVDDEEDGGKAAKEDSGDPMYDEAMSVILREGKVSTSFIQRHLQIGYNRAARIIEQMENEGVVSKANATGKREILR